MPFVDSQKVPFSVRISPKLKEWLESKAKWLPHERGPGKREGENLGRYIEMILEAHRKGATLDVPEPPALPIEDQSVIVVMRELREKRRPLFDAILSLVASSGEIEESARAVESLAALANRAGSARSRAGRG